jgi:dihydropteroate synthase
VLGIAGGCRVVRVHDVAATVKIRDVVEAILCAGPSDDSEGEQ